jgi:hypothetical protein
MSVEFFPRELIRGLIDTVVCSILDSQNYS